MTYEYNAKLVHIVDGDTLYLDVDLGCDVRITLDIRLYGLNAPERYTDLGKVATAYVTTWFQENSSLDGTFLLRTQKDRKEKYGRYLGTIVSTTTGRCLNDDLIASDNAVAYLL